MDPAVAAAEPPVPTTKDPVCGMTVKIGLAKGGSATHDGHEYWFCNPKCRETFIGDPVMYLERAAARAAAPPPPAPAAAPPAPAAASFTCPMHPEVRQAGPGDCPLRGL